MPAFAQGSSLAQVSQADCHMQGSTRKGFRPRDCIRELIVYLLIDSYTDLTIHIGIPDKLPNDLWILHSSPFSTLQPSTSPPPAPGGGGFGRGLKPPSRSPLCRIMMEHAPRPEPKNYTNPKKVSEKKCSKNTHSSVNFTEPADHLPCNR